jgi:hypothetical protein
MKFIFVLILTCVTIQLNAQKITLSLPEKVSLQEKYSSLNKGYTDHIVNLNIKRDSVVASRDLLIKIKLEDFTSSSKDYELITQTILITRVQMMANDSINRAIHIRILNDSLKTDASDEFFTLIAYADTTGLNLKGFTPSKSKVTILDGKPSTELFYVNPFRITIGANFDLESTDPATFYFDAMAYHLGQNYDIGKNGLWKQGFGFYGSLYKNRYLSKDSIADTKAYLSLASAPGSIVDVVETTYKINVNRSYRNLGAEIGPIWGISKSTDTSYLSHAIIFPELSATSSLIGNTFTYTKSNQDTLFGVPNPENFSSLVEQDFYNYRRDQFLLGGGYIFRFMSKSAGEFTFKVTSGLAFQKGLSVKNIYYSFRCQLLDPIVHANLGIEIRGFYGQANPYFGIYLSKSFTLKKLTEY